MKALGFNPSKDHHTIRQPVLDFSEEVREICRHIYVKEKELSLTLDEWTSTRNRRYLNINIHVSEERFKSGANYWCLGLAKIDGSMPAEVCLTVLRKRLSEYNAKLETNIVGFTSDGASVMVKLGTLLKGILHQLCLAHGLHLAAVDAVYRPEDPHAETQVLTLTLKKYAGTFSFEYGNGKRQSARSHSESVSEVIKAVRKAILFFKRSPKNNDILQKYVMNDHGTQLTSLLD